MAGLLDALFDPYLYSSGPGGLLARLAPSLDQITQSQGFPQVASASFADRFNALPGAPQPFSGSGRSFDTAQFDPQTFAPNQAQPIAVGNYQMPRIGSADQFNPQQALIPPNAQPAQGQMPGNAYTQNPAIPQQAPQSSTSQTPAVIPSNPGGLSAGVNGFLNNLHTGPIGALIGGIGSAAGLESASIKQAKLTQNLTAQALLRAGAPIEDVQAAIQPGNAKLLELLYTKYLNREKVRPATPEERKAYGAPDNLPMSIDTTTGKPTYGPAGTSISNVINGEKEQDKVIGKGYGERFNEIQKAGIAAPAAIGTLKLMERLISDPNFYSGTGGESATALKRLAVSLGIKDAESASPNELFQKLSQKSVLDAAGGSLGTGFSNADREYLNGTVANISNTPEGNKLIIQIGKQVQQRNLEIAKQAREYAKTHNGRIDSGFEEQIADYAEKNPLFANVAPPPKAASGSYQEGATATNPQTGQTLTFRNGKWQ